VACSSQNIETLKVRVLEISLDFSNSYIIYSVRSSDYRSMAIASLMHWGSNGVS